MFSILKNKIDFLCNDYIIVINITHNIIDNSEDVVNNVRSRYTTASAHHIRTLIAKHFIPSNDEKKENAEIFTPVKLVDEMLA